MESIDIQFKIDPIEAILYLYPYISREEAAEYLREIKRQQIEFPS